MYHFVTESKTDLSRQNIIHGQDVDFGIEGKWCFDLGSDHLGTIDLQQLIDLSARRDYPLERHITRGTVCANGCLIIANCKYAVFDPRTDETIGLSIPTL